MDGPTANAIESLMNLLYLIRLRAASPQEVLAFVDMAKQPMEVLVSAARNAASRHLPPDPASEQSSDSSGAKL